MTIKSSTRHYVVGFLFGLIASSLLSSFHFTEETILRVIQINATSDDESPLPADAGNERDSLDGVKVVPYGKYCDPVVIGEKQSWNKHKKIISYSLFASATDELKRGTKAGDIPKWVKEGIDIQATTALTYYPDWIIRFHVTDFTPEYEQEIVTKHKNAELVRCKRMEPKSSNSRMMIPRYMTVDDPSVWLTIVRDVDSRFTLRELMAVNEWIASVERHPFHVMRDHPQQSLEVLGGTAGMARGMLDDSQDYTSMVELVDLAIETYPNRPIPGCCGEDQSFLATYVWPRVVKTALSHDSIGSRCRRYSRGAEDGCRDYPLGPQDISNYYFVGAPFKEKERFTSNVTGHTCSLVCDKL